jgi:hypothetical protein
MPRYFFDVKNATGFLMHQALSVKMIPMQSSGLRCSPSAFHLISPKTSLSAASL